MVSPVIPGWEGPFLLVHSFSLELRFGSSTPMFFFFQICDVSGLVTIQNSPLAKFGYINKVKKSRTPAILGPIV